MPQSVRDYIVTLQVEVDPAQEKKIIQRQQKLYSKQIDSEKKQRLRNAPVVAKEEERVKALIAKKAERQAKRKSKREETKAKAKAIKPTSSKGGIGGAGALGLLGRSAPQIAGAIAVASVAAKLLKPILSRLFGDATGAISKFTEDVTASRSAGVVGRQTNQSAEQIRQLRTDFFASGLQKSQADQIAKNLFQTTRTQDTESTLKGIVKNLRGGSAESISAQARAYGIDEDVLTQLVNQAEKGQTLGTGVKKVSSKGQSNLLKQGFRKDVGTANIQTKAEEERTKYAKDLADASIKIAEKTAIDAQNSAVRAKDQAQVQKTVSNIDKNTEKIAQGIEDYFKELYGILNPTNLPTNKISSQNKNR